jgi:hypothetical protein
MGSLFSERNLIVSGLEPVANAFAGTVYSDIIDAGDADGLAFLVYWGVGATGTTLITVEACDDIVASNVSAVAFRSRRVADVTASDVPGALTSRASTGFTTTAGSHQLYLIEVDPDVLAASGYRYARLKCVEQTASALLGGIFVLLSKLRNAQATPASVID